MPAKPFVKWAGGKTQLLEILRQKYPHRIEKYCEPFVGGGAVLFDVLNTFRPETVFINDINKELINTYRQIRDAADVLIAQLAEIQDTYRNQSLEKNKELFYEKRSRYNELKMNGTAAENLEKAALFIFLNKTCFNGLYRVNSNGFFNVPFNNAKNPAICDAENLQECSRLLQNVEMLDGDYKNCRNFIDDKTFVYIDPPYRPLTQTSAFTSYSESGFSDKEQIELGSFIEELSQKGAHIVASNSDPKNADANDTFFDDLYSSFRIERISASRMINSKSDGRGNINELLITNREKTDYIPIADFLEDAFSKYGELIHKFPIEKIKFNKNRLSYANPVFDSTVNNIVYNFHEEGWEPISLDTDYYLRDGQHRLAAAKMMGLKYIDVVIFLWYKNGEKK